MATLTRACAGAQNYAGGREEPQQIPQIACLPRSVAHRTVVTYFSRLAPAGRPAGELDPLATSPKGIAKGAVVHSQPSQSKQVNMLPKELKSIRAEYKWSQKEAAAYLGVVPNTVN